MAHRVVITGLGVIHGLAEDPEVFYDALIHGKSGIDRITGFDPLEYPSQVASECKTFNPEAHMDPKEARRNDRFVQFAVAAAKNAAAMAGLQVSEAEADRVGVIIGSGVGGIKTTEEQVRVSVEKGPRRVSPFTIPMLICNMASGVVAIHLNARGPNYAVVSACASGSHAIGDAYDILRRGIADVMLAGGAEAAVTPMTFASFCSMKALAADFNSEPERASRPFDAQRCGFVMGEGAGILVLETLEHAKARGATILAELVGSGASCDAFHITQPEPEGKGMTLCIKRALEGIDPASVDYINAHGTSTAYNDKIETLVFKKVFGEHARKVAISSTKSMTGHLLGAAGGIEAIIAVQTIRHGIIPPTINYEFPDPECDLSYTPNKAVERKVRIAISDNLGFGGQNACLVFKAFED